MALQCLNVVIKQHSHIGVVNEQHSHDGVPLLQVGKNSVWSAIEIVSSVDLVGWYANWSGSRVSGTMVLSHDQPFKAFHGYKCECNGSGVI